MGISDQYRALKETAAVGAVAARGTIAVAGKDRASYLHGLLTNDVQSLGDGDGCYAAWLTPQGRMITDLYVLASGDRLLLDVPEALTDATLQRLDQFLFGEDVQLENLSRDMRQVWLHGPAAPGMLERVMTGGSGLEGWPEHHNARLDFAGTAVLVVRASQLGVPGFCVYVGPEREDDLRQALLSAGAVAADPAVVEAARIEAGYPIFGVDMTDDTIPLEAGIEDRAISFTKGCYVGQEVIVRVLHRGHGRVARKLVGLRIEGGVPARGATIRSGAREIGAVTSAADSPRLGSIGLAYVHRDFIAPGTRVELDGPAGRAGALVTERPIA